MAIHDSDINMYLTHHDMCRLFGLDDDDLPTSNGYEPELLSKSLSVTHATISHSKTTKGQVDDWHEMTQTTSPHAHVSFVDQTSSDINNFAMLLLETALLTQDVMEFQALVNAIPWSNQAPSDLVEAIHMALALEAPLIVRKLAEQGKKTYPTHREIIKVARILATPSTTSTTSSIRLDTKANKLWIKANREVYRRKWVALHNGELIASGQTFSDLAARMGDVKGKGILVTQVT